MAKVRSNDYAIGPLQHDFRTLPYAVSLYVAEKVTDVIEDVDGVARAWAPLQWALVLASAALIFFSLGRLWRSCTV